MLRTHQLGEADRIITLLTRAHGKVRAVAKGVRRTSSKFGGRLEPFQHIDIQFAEGRGALEVVTQVEALHSSKLGADYSRFTAAEVLVETADRLVAEERVPSLQQYRLLLGALLALEAGDRPAPLIVDSYLLRSLAVAGYAVSTTACAGCGDMDVRWFSPQGGGAACVSCRTSGSAQLGPTEAAHIARCSPASGRRRWPPTARWPSASTGWSSPTPPGTWTGRCGRCPTSSADRTPGRGRTARVRGPCR